jgi:hypothetical protein
MTRKTTRKTQSTQTAQAAPVINLAQFAKKVNEVARWAPESMKFGPNKTYICKVWELGFKNQMDLNTFKEYLKQAHIQGLLYLSRADLVSVMNQEWLRLSEIQLVPGSLTAAAHFVLIV